MKKILLISLLSIGVFACEQNTSQENEGDKKETVNNDEAVAPEETIDEEAAEEGAALPDPDAVGNFGAEISAEGAVGGAELLTQLASQDSVMMKVRSSIAECCQAKGCWMTMPLEGEQEMTVKFKDYAFFAPMNSIGKDAVVEGWAYKEVVSVEELRHLAEDNNASAEEVEAITEPEERITFMASGLIVEPSEAAAE